MYSRRNRYYLDDEALEEDLEELKEEDEDTLSDDEEFLHFLFATGRDKEFFGFNKKPEEKVLRRERNTRRK